MAEAGKLTAAIDRTYALAEAPDAFRYLGTHGVSGKLVVRVR
jgi:NADPH:quinone reductase-like Zn-dependent oxidoreductase